MHNKQSVGACDSKRMYFFSLVGREKFGIILCKMNGNKTNNWFREELNIILL